MKVGVVVFPGSNCDHDAFYAVSQNLGHKAEFIWHDSESLGDVDAVILPGGFSYGDYLRCGAIARFSPVMKAVKNLRRTAGWFWVSVTVSKSSVKVACFRERSSAMRDLKFLCKPVQISVETINSPFTHGRRRDRC